MPVRPRNEVLWVKAAGIAAAVGLSAAAALILMPPFTECTPSPPVSDHRHWFRAAEIVVQPWLGQHHVYGIFSVPEQYGRHRLYKAKLVIQDMIDDLPETSPEAGRMYGNRVDPGRYVMRVHLPTRRAFWLLLTGRFGDLKKSCHWWVVMADR